MKRGILQVTLRDQVSTAQPRRFSSPAGPKLSSAMVHENEVRDICALRLVLLGT